ncbi:hypothetical protein D3C85_1754700 [compost metagenome]
MKLRSNAINHFWQHWDNNSESDKDRHQQQHDDSNLFIHDALCLQTKSFSLWYHTFFGDGNEHLKNKQCDKHTSTH